MGAGSVVRITMVAVGVVIMAASFWFLAVKKMTAGFAVVWEIIGVMLVAAGMFLFHSVWTEVLYNSGELIAVGIGAIGLLLCYLFSIVVSRLTMRNYELAIEVSMLLQEQGRAPCRKREKELLIILPVKNEEKNIGKVLEQLSRPEIKKIADVLCINDASTDDSGKIIDGFQCMQIKNIFSLGYGSALQLGYKYAVRMDYRYVIQMDADGQHDACNIPVIYAKLREKETEGQEPDIVLASRFMNGSSEFQVSAAKKFAFWLFRSMIHVVTGRRIADPTTGMQGLSRKALMYYSQYNNFDYQYPDANMIMQMLLLKFQIAEVPAVMYARADGKSMHEGLEPVGYMMRMFLSVLAVAFRVKVLGLK